MLSRAEIDRLTAAAVALRPDWSPRTVRTVIEVDHTHRAYRDLAVALTWVATDATCRTPHRINMPGPWWNHLSPVTNNSVPHSAPRCPRPGHETNPAHNCAACRSEQLAATCEDHP